MGTTIGPRFFDLQMTPEDQNAILEGKKGFLIKSGYTFLDNGTKVEGHVVTVLKDTGRMSGFIRNPIQSIRAACYREKILEKIRTENKKRGIGS